jgi:hypothetical protein
LINAFEIFTHIPPENTGPKVLYMTPKVEGCSEKEILTDIEGHPIEKILSSKLSEKAL